MLVRQAGCPNRRSGGDCGLKTKILYVAIDASGKRFQRAFVGPLGGGRACPKARHDLSPRGFIK